MSTVRSLRAYQPETPDSPNDWRTSLGQVIVEIETEDGLRGIGVGGGGKAGVHVIETVLAEVIVHRDSTDIETIHEEMCEHTQFYGRKGLVIMALSGVDLALWDLRGKRAGSPVAQLLKPDVDLSQPLPTYRTVFGDAETRKAMEDGHEALKLHVERFGDRPGAEVVRELVERARELLGDSQPIMLDAFARWDVQTTLEVAHAIAPYNVEWLEEPLRPDDYTGYALLAKESPIPIAGGEHEYLRDGFRQLIDGKLHQILQPDVNWCGGLTTLIEIYEMAQAAGLRVCPHRGSEPFSLPAIAVLDNSPLAESPRAWFDVLNGAPTIRDGKIRCSSAPGFGVSPR